MLKDRKELTVNQYIVIEDLTKKYNHRVYSIQALDKKLKELYNKKEQLLIKQNKHSTVKVFLKERN